jgi:cytochrome c
MRAVIALFLLLLGGCGASPAGDARAREARALIAAHCGTCHVVPGVRTATGTVGPPLAGLARRQVIAGHFANSRSNLINWIAHPQEMSPGNAMPDTGVDARQSAIIADYLYSLDDDR